MCKYWGLIIILPLHLGGGTWYPCFPKGLSQMLTSLEKSLKKEQETSRGLSVCTALCWVLNNVLLWPDFPTC